MTTTHHYLMFFTNMGKVYRLKAYEIPEAGRTARGTAIINLLQLQAGEKITAVLSLKDYSQGQYLFMATKSGIVKKTPIQDYANVRKTGLAAISLKDDDELIEVKVTPQRDTGFDKTAERICNYPEVSAVYLISGDFDMMVLIEGKTLQEVSKFVSSKLSPIEDVTGTSTQFVLKKYKDHGTIMFGQKKTERMLVTP